MWPDCSNRRSTPASRPGDIAVRPTSWSIVAGSPPSAASVAVSSASKVGASAGCQCSPARPATELDQEIARIEEYLRTVLDQCVAPGRGAVAARARQCEHGAAVVVRVLGGDGRAAGRRRLDDDAHVAQRGDDAVPHRELRRVRLDAVRVLAHDEAVRAHGGVQRAVAARIRDVEPGRDDTDRVSAARERALVRGAVDAEREPADDGDAGAAEERADLARIGEPVRRRGAGTDDRDARRARTLRARTLRRTARVAAPGSPRGSAQSSSPSIQTCVPRRCNSARVASGRRGARPHDREVVARGRERPARPPRRARRRSRRARPPARRTARTSGASARA